MDIKRFFENSTSLTLHRGSENLKIPITGSKIFLYPWFLSIVTLIFTCSILPTLKKSCTTPLPPPSLSNLSSFFDWQLPCLIAINVPQDISRFSFSEWGCLFPIKPFRFHAWKSKENVEQFKHNFLLYFSSCFTITFLRKHSIQNKTPWRKTNKNDWNLFSE